MPDIDTLLDSLEKDTLTQLERVYKDMSRRLDDYIGSFETAQGAFVNTPENILRTANAQAQIEQIFRESGYNDVVDNFVRKYQDITDQMVRDYAAMGIDPAFTSLDVQSLRTAAQFDIQRFETIGRQGAETVTRGLFDSVTGQGNALSFIDSIRASVPDYFKRWASTYATTAGSTFARTVEDKIQQEAGIEKFEYFGPLDSNTRPFCADLLTKGGTHTREEIAKMDNGQTPPGTVKIAGGGWNCRHRWLGA
jgi:hypothetical protein